MKRKILHMVTKAVVPQLSPSFPPSKDVAILVPLSREAMLTEEEQISMRQLLHHLRDYDKYLIAPDGVDLDFPGFGVKRFSRKFFGSAAAHGRLLNHHSFYKEFEGYKFVLFYHLDSLAFSDQLDEWCQTDLDYVGPPWINCPDSPWVETPRVGNGGFALLRVQSALKVFQMRYQKEPLTYWLDIFTRHAPVGVIPLLEKFHTIFPRSFVLGRFLQEWREVNDPSPHNRNNDMFWSDLATFYLPEFKVASVAEGLRFAFEVAPRTCYEMNGRKMPFGCHAWARYDREFWEPFLVGSIEKAKRKYWCQNGSSREAVR
jgi:hypothetical protein